MPNFKEIGVGEFALSDARVIPEPSLLVASKLDEIGDIAYSAYDRETMSIMLFRPRNSEDFFNHLLQFIRYIEKSPLAQPRDEYFVEIHAQAYCTGIQRLSDYAASVYKNIMQGLWEADHRGKRIVQYKFPTEMNMVPLTINEKPIVLKLRAVAKLPFPAISIHARRKEGVFYEFSPELRKGFNLSIEPSNTLDLNDTVSTSKGMKMGSQG